MDNFPAKTQFWNPGQKCDNNFATGVSSSPPPPRHAVYADTHPPICSAADFLALQSSRGVAGGRHSPDTNATCMFYGHPQFVSEGFWACVWESIAAIAFVWACLGPGRDPELLTIQPILPSCAEWVLGRGCQRIRRRGRILAQSPHCGVCAFPLPAAFCGESHLFLAFPLVQSKQRQIAKV